VLGLPSYGYVSRSYAERLKTRFLDTKTGHLWHQHEDSEKHHHHSPMGVDSWHDHDGGWGWHNHNGSDDDGGEYDDDNDDGDGWHSEIPIPTDPTASRPVIVDDSENQVQFRELVRQGALAKTTDSMGKVKYIASGGFERRWDSCSETPFLRSTGAGQIITYDDSESLSLKARFARDAGLLGVNVFDVHGDTDDGHLLHAIREAMGL